MTDERTPHRPDPTVPNVARIYDHLLGGKDNYEADRAAARRLVEISPDTYVAIRENRAFLGRAVRFAAESGIRQFLDVGSGLPTQANVHEIAAGVAPGCRVVYADNDPVVISHGRALLKAGPDVAMVEGDAADLDALCAHEEVGRLIDFGRPVAVLFAAVLHFVAEPHTPQIVSDWLHRTLCPGSLVVISHGTAEPFPDRGDAAGAVYRQANVGLNLRSRAEIARFFEGFELVDPGLVYVPEWRPDPSGALSEPQRSGLLGAVGRKP
jgi:hypothetical protein